MCVFCIFTLLRSIRFVASCSLTSCLQNRVYVSVWFFFALFAFGLFFSFFIRFSFTDRFTSKNFNRCLDRARVTVCMLCTPLLLLCKCVNVHLIFSLNYADLRSFVRWPGEMRKSTRPRELNEIKRKKKCVCVCRRRQRRRFVAFIESATCYNDRQ